MRDLLFGLSADVALALFAVGLPLAVLLGAFVIAWAVRPGLASGRA